MAVKLSARMLVLFLFLLSYMYVVNATTEPTVTSSPVLNTDEDDKELLNQIFDFMKLIGAKLNLFNTTLTTVNQRFDQQDEELRQLKLVVEEVKNKTELLDVKGQPNIGSSTTSTSINSTQLPTQPAATKNTVGGTVTQTPSKTLSSNTKTMSKASTSTSTSSTESSQAPVGTPTVQPSVTLTEPTDNFTEPPMEEEEDDPEDSIVVGIPPSTNSDGSNGIYGLVIAILVLLVLSVGLYLIYQYRFQIRDWIISKENQVQDQIHRHSNTRNGTGKRKYNVLPQNVHDTLHND